MKYIKYNKYYLIISFILLFCYFFIFISCKEHGIDEPNLTIQTEITKVQFDNLERYSVTIYSDPARLNVFSKIAALSSSTETADPAPFGIAFYPTFNLDLFGVVAVSIPYDAPHVPAVIQENKTNKILIPQLEDININFAFIKVINNSNVSLSLRQGSSTEKEPLGGRSSIIMTGETAVYDVIPGLVSLYSFMRNTLTQVSFPADFTEFKGGIIYIFNFTDAGLFLTEQTSVLQSISPVSPDIIQAEVVSNSNILVSWNEVYGATSYRIYRATGSPTATYSHIGSSSSLSFTDITVSAGYTYYYAIRALSGLNNISVQSPSVSINMSPSNLRLIASTTINITLAWNIFNSASCYNLYRSDSENGTYTKINSELLTMTILTDTDVLPDTTYYYKVSVIIDESESLQ